MECGAVFTSGKSLAGAWVCGLGRYRSVVGKVTVNFNYLFPEFGLFCEFCTSTARASAIRTAELKFL